MVNTDDVRAMVEAREKRLGYRMTKADIAFMWKAHEEEKLQTEIGMKLALDVAGFVYEPTPDELREMAQHVAKVAEQLYPLRHGYIDAPKEGRCKVVDTYWLMDMVVRRINEMADGNYECNQPEGFTPDGPDDS